MITASFYGSNLASTKERRNMSQSDKGTTMKFSFVTRDDSSCPVCGHEYHLITDCKQFDCMGVSDRMATLRKYRLCERCTGRHHTLVKVENEKRTVGPQKPSEESAQKVSTNLVNRDPNSTVFWAALAKAYNAVEYLRVQTDSMIVLSWTKGGAAKWKLFVSNRIIKILETSEASQLRHVATADNLADHLSGGLSVNNLSSSELWGHGPYWLQAAESEWPTTEIDIGLTTEIKS
ncbi:hypothetical protein ACLKA7_007764, partial [Drosophila subpalustris]